MFHFVGRWTMLQWRPRLVVIAAVIALILIAVLGAELETGGFGGDLGDTLRNLYW
jgi:hypothetical protein